MNWFNLFLKNGDDTEFSIKQRYSINLWLNKRSLLHVIRNWIKCKRYSKKRAKELIKELKEGVEK